MRRHHKWMSRRGSRCRTRKNRVMNKSATTSVKQEMLIYLPSGRSEPIRLCLGSTSQVFRIHRADRVMDEVHRWKRSISQRCVWIFSFAHAAILGQTRCVILSQQLCIHGWTRHNPMLISSTLSMVCIIIAMPMAMPVTGSRKQDMQVAQASFSCAIQAFLSSSACASLSQSLIQR